MKKKGLTSAGKDSSWWKIILIDQNGISLLSPVSEDYKSLNYLKPNTVRKQM